MTPTSAEARARLAVADAAYADASRVWCDQLVTFRQAQRDLAAAIAQLDAARQVVELALSDLLDAEARPLVDS